MGVRRALGEYEKAIAIYNEEGNFAQTGKLYKMLGEALEEDTNAVASGEEWRECVDYYQRACDMFEMDDYGKSNFTNCSLKI